MYLDFYKLRLMPFEIGPDPTFLWLGSKHKEAFAALLYSILQSKGFILILGDPGTGKSTLLNATEANFGSKVRFAKITEPAMSEMDFFNFVANALDMGKTFTNKADFLIALGKFVKEAGAQSKKVILVIDEAQRLTTEMLEQIRVLVNIETPGKKVVSFIFAGHTEFLDMVKQNKALAQRVFFSHIIQPLTQSETGDYIRHRLKIAGTEEPIFTPAAVQEVYRLTDGIPRLINILCDQALLSGYFHKKRKIGPELIEESTENTLISIKMHSEDVSSLPMQDALEQLATPELAIPANRELSQTNPPVLTNLEVAKNLRRRTAYWALAVLISVLGVAVYYFSTQR
jgi:general secretion pathway protein A